MFEEFTKYQGHVNNPNRMAEITGRCFDRAMSEMGPTQLNIPRDYFYGDIDVEIPQPMRVDRGPGGEKTLNEAVELIAQAKFPRYSFRWRRGNGRCYRRMHSTGGALTVPGG